MNKDTVHSKPNEDSTTLPAHCPFCGELPLHRTWAMGEFIGNRIECLSEHCPIGPQTKISYCQSDVLNWWNKRVPEPASSAGAKPKQKMWVHNPEGHVDFGDGSMPVYTGYKAATRIVREHNRPSCATTTEAGAKLNLSEKAAISKKIRELGDKDSEELRQTTSFATWKSLGENLLEIENHCPCGARPESPNTHPHVTGCPVARAIESLRALREPGCLCQGCGSRYLEDVTVPDSIWERIKPRGKPEGAGLLCGQCIANRLLNEPSPQSTASTRTSARPPSKSPAAASLEERAERLLSELFEINELDSFRKDHDDEYQTILRALQGAQ